MEENQNLQGDLQIREYIEKLKALKDSTCKLEEAERIIVAVKEYVKMQKVNEEDKLHFYQLIGSLYENALEWEKSYNYFFRCFEISSKIQNVNDTLDCMRNLCRVRIRQGSYKEAILFGEYAIEYATFNEIQWNTPLKAIYFNTALSYKKIENYEKCLEVLTKLKPYLIQGEKIYFDAMVLAANSYYCLERYKEAEKINNMIIEQIQIKKDCDIPALVYRNMCFIKLKLGKKKDAIEYLRMARAHTVGDSKFIAATNAFNTILLYIELEDTKNIEQTYALALDHAAQIKDQEMELDIVNRIFSYCIKKKENEYMIAFLEDVKKRVIAGRIQSKTLLEIYVKAFHYLKDLQHSAAEAVLQNGVEIVNFLSKK